MSLDSFFKAKTIAVFGVSRNPEKPGRVLYENLTKGGFSGKVYPVNPNLTELNGVPFFNLETLPSVDLGIFIIPATAVVETLSKIANKLKGALIISGGFGEVGRHDLDEQLLRIAKKYKIRIVGPNCVGIMNSHTGMNATFLPESRMNLPKKGTVSLLSQSGATVASLIDWSNQMNLGFSKIISYGNQLDVDETEIIQYFMKDKQTRAIGFYLEGLKNGKKFLKKVNVKKPIIALKAGITEKGVSAAKSHTGTLAGSYEIYKGIFSQKGIVLVNNVETFINSMKLITLSRPKNKRVAIVTCGGGYGVMASDALALNNINLANFSEKTLNSLKKHYPEHIVVNNPLDLTGSATPEDFEFALHQVSKDKSVDAIIVVFLFQLPLLNETVTNALKLSIKPTVVVSPPGKFATKVNEKLMQNSLVVSTPEMAAKVLKTFLI